MNELMVDDCCLLTTYNPRSLRLRDLWLAHVAPGFADSRVSTVPPILPVGSTLSVTSIFVNSTCIALCRPIQVAPPDGPARCGSIRPLSFYAAARSPQRIRTAIKP